MNKKAILLCLMTGLLGSPGALALAGSRSSQATRLTKLRPVLQERLRIEGFDQNQIDVTIRELNTEFQKEPMSVSDAIQRPAKSLNLDSGQQKRLGIIYLQSMARSLADTEESSSR